VRRHRPLQRTRRAWKGAYAHDLLEVEHENLAVADLARVGGFLDCFEHAIEHVGLYRRLDLHFRQEIDHVLRAAVELGVALLPAEALHFGDREAGHADFGERLAYFVELERFDDRFDLLHRGLLNVAGVSGVSGWCC
jgi:hypothetical protein